MPEINEAQLREKFEAWARTEWGDRAIPDNAWIGFKAGVRLGSQSTPGAEWREKGEPDPHGTTYDCERAQLPMGELTDDELANAVFLFGNHVPNMADVLAGKAKMPIAYLTAAKDRIRWLSRQLAKAAVQG